METKFKTISKENLKNIKGGKMTLAEYMLDFNCESTEFGYRCTPK